MSLVITGCCGFIGTNLCLNLLKKTQWTIYGVDNFSDNYDVEFKKKNLEELEQFQNFTCFPEDICSVKLNLDLDLVIHLASVPGVRKSMEDPKYYVKNNIEGFVHILEECRRNNIPKVVYASSSSVYGSNEVIPFNEEHPTENIRSSYACSKKCMEIYAKYYNDVYDIQTIGLRFFTVYGERGRPDMAPYIFLKNIFEEKIITQYGNGSSSRDYTYVGDIVQGIVSIINGQGVWGSVYNLGNNNPLMLSQFIELCEKITGKIAIKNIIENQLGDVPRTLADISKAQKELYYRPKTTLEEGLEKMFNWMLENGRINIEPTIIPLQVFEDDRGNFTESFSLKKITQKNII